MKNSYFIHSEGDMKTSTSFPSHSACSKPRTSHKMEYRSQISEQMGLQNTQCNSLIEMIGHQRLLDSMSNFSYNSKTSNHSPLITSEDRFIPNRKDLLTTYNLTTPKQNQQNINYKDPQSLDPSDIFSQEVLRNKPILSQDTFLYRNQNILKYQHHEKRTVRNFDKKLSLICYQPLKILRKVNKVPSKVLDAPSLQDDFYLNLIDWSKHNQLAVGLGNSIYLWNATNSKVTKLCQISRDMITSVAWAIKDNTIAIGCNSGIVQIWDVKKQKIVRKLPGHQMRVGSMSWNTTCLATGSRDKTILQRDLRMSGNYCIKMDEHTQEICGLKWSFDGNYLASGGNDNKVVVWSSGGQVLNKFTDHQAAVKALAWSPHQHGLLATGGGTIDRMIKMRNIFTGSILCQRDAGSQICNLAFSKSLQEIVSTHGYSQHQINLWSYPNMNKVATLVGHTHRVLYLATSPDGSTIVTGAGDETLRFWNVFPSIRTEKGEKDRKLIGEITLR